MGKKISNLTGVFRINKGDRICQVPATAGTEDVKLVVLTVAQVLHGFDSGILEVEVKQYHATFETT